MNKFDIIKITLYETHIIWKIYIYQINIVYSEDNISIKIL